MIKIKLKNKINNSFLLQLLAKEIQKDPVLIQKGSTQHTKVILEQVVRCYYKSDSDLGQDLREKGLEVVLIANEYTIWSKDLVFCIKNQPDTIVVVQACVWKKFKMVTFRMYSKPVYSIF